MKKLILTVAVIMGLSSINLTKANEHIYNANYVETDLKVKALKGLKFQVTALNMSEKSILEIKDTEGNVVYKTILSDLNYIKVYDLSSLPDGSYSWILKTGENSKVKPFEIKTETIRKFSDL